ncbi:MAG TPA: bifunctional 4-hydroxy-3-methylbut-2-enyl diphosphate reductase/30S ribosomal protein S1 [Firmicutes bacterium]|nr:bifunctional 4-hydroxy-3-methylbut-2-enyl diphosphate reductase/30S ribosomal protein S1 [Bacillota bacterium]
MRLSRVVLADKYGMCYGVRRAIDIVCRNAGSGSPVFTLGPLVHNSSVTRWLEDRGVHIARDLDRISGGTVVIPSHGISPAVIDDLRSRGVNIIDATCPNVTRSQKIVKDMLASGYKVAIVGDPDHTEVKGLIGCGQGEVVVVSSVEEAKAKVVGPKIGIVAQTTVPVELFDAIVAELSSRAQEVAVENTICMATIERQRAARQLAHSVDAALVIGSRASANAQRLKQIVEKENIPAFLVENAEEAAKVNLAGVRSLGITAGASTPSWVIEEVLAKMAELSEERHDNMSSVGQELDTMPDMKAGEDQLDDKDGNSEAAGVSDGGREFHEGDIVTGTIVKVDPDEVLVDIGYKSEGIIRLADLSNRRVNSAADVVSVGDSVDVKIKAFTDDGDVILSKKEADTEKAWERILNALSTGEVVQGKVTDVVKGGVVVDVGVRGFVPASQIGLRPVRDLHTLVGNEIRMKVLEAEKDRNNVVLSERAVLEQEMQEKRAKAFEALREGEIREGIVRRVVNFGAFVDIGDNLEGLLHVSDMTWGRTRDPHAILNEGDRVRVKVLGVDRERERISLGLKQTMPDPWQNIESRYPIGSIVTGKVTKLVDFGAFVELEDGIEGLVHVSQISDKRVAKPEEVLHPGDEVNVKVISLKPADRRIGLSIKEAQPRQEKEDYKKYSGKETEPPGPTLGDVFGELGELLEKERGKEEK